MEKTVLTQENIFYELKRGYHAIPLDCLNTDLVLKFNTWTFELYKWAYAHRFGYSLPAPINFMGIEIEIDNHMKDNYYEISSK